MPAALLKFVERFPVVATVDLAAVIVTVWWWSGGNVELLTLDGRLWQGQVWRLFSSALPHVNVIHLVFNLWCLAVFGSRVEQVYGSLVTALLLLLFDAGSMVAEYALADGGVGLSGVGYGLFGFLWVLSKRDPRFTGSIDAQTTQWLIGWFFLCLALTVTHVMPVANVAHAAGAGFGALTGWAMSPSARQMRLVAIASLICSLAAVMIAATVARPYVNFTGAVGRELAQQGYEYLHRDENAAAVQVLQQAVQQRNAQAWWWHNLGIAYHRQGRIRDAAIAFRRAYELDPSDSEARDEAQALEAAAKLEDLFRQPPH